MEWTASYDDSSRRATITRPSGSTIPFQAQPGSHLAYPDGDSRKLDYQVQFVNEDDSPCTQGTPAYIDMVLSSGMIMRFSAATGKVTSMTTSNGNVITAEARQEGVQVTRDEQGRLQSIYSKTQGLMSCAYASNKLTIQWFSPEHVTVSNGQYTTTGDPYKTTLYQTWKDYKPALPGTDPDKDAATLTRITTSRPGQTPQVILRRETPGCVTITKGEGDEQIIRTITTRTIDDYQGDQFAKLPGSFSPGPRWERIETVQGINDNIPASCVRSIRKHTAGGWLDVSHTEGYGTPLARTTFYVYNSAFRVSMVIKPDGGYTRYEYDDQHRAILTATPWAGGGERATRTTYINLLTNDHRPTVKEKLILAEDGRQTVLSRKEYVYENSAQRRRTTITETALGSDQVHTSFEETHGPLAECPYARGRSSYNRSVDGMRNLYSYEETSDYGASWKMTTTILGDHNGTPIDHALNVDYISDNGVTLRSERHAYTGQGWSLLSCEEYQYDMERRRVKTTKGNGRTNTTEWMCCGPLKETDEDGIVTSYGYNSARQLVETIRSATETTPETIVSYTRDSAGKALCVRTDVGPMATMAHTSYDTLGRIVSSTDALGRVTTYAYSEDGLTTTVTTPSGATLIEKVYYDRTITQKEGTGQRAIETRQELTPEGILTTTLSQGVILSRTLANGFGQTIRQDQPNTQGSFIITKRLYNAKGQLVRSQTEDMAPTLMEYSFGFTGQKIRQILLLDATQPNNPQLNRITEQDNQYQIIEGDVYRIQIQTTYNTQGQRLTQTGMTLLSQFNPTLESKSITTDVYGNRSEQWTSYAGPARRTQYSKEPTSETTARTELVDGFAVSQTDHANLTTRQERSYTVEGMILRHTDQRGNTTITQTDIAGRTVKTTDAEGNSTTIAYGPCCDNPAIITNALGGTTCYAYDLRGRKTAEYGTAVQPACFSYDEADNIVQMATFRAREEDDIIADPSQRTDGDITRWTYDATTGLELVKTYADGSQVSKTYDALNRLTTLTKARGIVTTHSYAPLTGELISATHNDGTQGWRFAYNHLGQMTTVSDASGTREISRDAYGRVRRETVLDSGINAFIEESFDALGRSKGYSLNVNDAITQQNTLAYDDKGRLHSMAMDGHDKTFTWSYDPASGFLSQLSYPNGMVRNDNYLPKRNLITSIEYRKAADTSLLAGHTYGYDNLGRPVNRQDNLGVNQEPEVHRFTYNTRSELTSDLLSSGELNGSYDYDNIGNRKTAQEQKQQLNYDANQLNQYTAINSDDSGGEPFPPAFDADGNQTLLQTDMGIWKVTYDANDRPVTFTSDDQATIIHCGYDFMGRRFEKKTTVNGTLASHERYLYRGYLQIASLDMLATRPALMHSYIWDPTQPSATRLLGMTRHHHNNGNDLEYLYYVHDALKNVTALIDNHNVMRASYAYCPFGGIRTIQGDLAQENKFRFSCEFADDDTGLIYYNYRHLNPIDGRWINRDPGMYHERFGLYNYVHNKVYQNYDQLGLWALLDDLIATTAGAVVGVVGQLISDAIQGELSSWKEYGIAAASGAIAGEATLYGGPLAGSAAYILTSNLLEKLTSEEEITWCSMGVNMAMDGAVSLIAGPIAGKIAKNIKIRGINSGRNSWSAIGKSTMTKLKNGTIKRVGPKTIGKYIGSEVYDSIPESTLSEFSDTILERSIEFIPERPIIEQRTLIIKQRVSISGYIVTEKETIIFEGIQEVEQEIPIIIIYN